MTQIKTRNRGIIISLELKKKLRDLTGEEHKVYHGLITTIINYLDEKLVTMGNNAFNYSTDTIDRYVNMKRDWEHIDAEVLKTSIKPTEKLLKRHGGVLRVDICYPRSGIYPIKAIQVGLMDVRAADDIRIEYDFERDGWVIKQAQIFEWDADDKICDPQWKEVAFINAWASKLT